MMERIECDGEDGVKRPGGEDWIPKAGAGGSSPGAQRPGGAGSSLSRPRQAASCRRQALAYTTPSEPHTGSPRAPQARAQPQRVTVAPSSRGAAGPRSPGDQPSGGDEVGRNQGTAPSSPNHSPACVSRAWVGNRSLGVWEHPRPSAGAGPRPAVTGRPGALTYCNFFQVFP